MIQKPILVYDGVCNLCINAVKFLNRLDKHGRILYVPYQQVSLKILNKIDPVSLQGRMHVVLADDHILNGSTAVSEVCSLLFPIQFLCQVFTAPIVQRLYDWIARRRYRIFGIANACFTLDNENVH